MSRRRSPRNCNRNAMTSTAAARRSGSTPRGRTTHPSPRWPGLVITSRPVIAITSAPVTRRKLWRKKRARWRRLCTVMRARYARRCWTQFENYRCASSAATRCKPRGEHRAGLRALFIGATVRGLGKARHRGGHGHFYAKRLLESVGITDSEDGVLRISLAHYNSADDVARVIDALRELH